MDGASQSTTACVHSATATSANGIAIAAQCCDGATCVRRTSGNNVDCIAGVWSSTTFQYTTWQEAAGLCAREGAPA